MFHLSFYVSVMQQTLTCLYSTCGSVLACACAQYTRICTVLSSAFKLGVSCIILECLTICRHSRHPQRDLDSMAVANSQPAVFAQEHSLKSVKASVYT